MRLVLLASLLLFPTAASCARDETPHEEGDPGRPTVFLHGQGEQRLMRGTRPLFIVADSATVGSRTLVAGYEDVPPGDSGLTHKHLHEDELLFVHRGQLEVRLGDSTYRVGAGATVFIPRGTWIGFRAVGADTAGFLFVFNQPAFEKCLRALSARPGEPYAAPPPPTRARIDQACDWVVKPR
jgi:quercetin dioxygenase-like cupin family protein